jgi:hypothetical protein
VCVCVESTVSFSCPKRACFPMKLENSHPVIIIHIEKQQQLPPPQATSVDKKLDVLKYLNSCMSVVVLLALRLGCL